jgi:broad specificity phosphatase PhoE
MKATIWLVRHGETEWSRSGQHTGRTDIPLTEAGRAMAKKVAGPLAGQRFSHVFSSPLGRARETCELAGLGGEVELRDALMEWDYGAYEGKTTSEIRATRPGWSLWRDGVPGGESPQAISARVDGVIEELEKLEGNVAVFAHGHVLRCLTARWLELAVDFGRRLPLETASLGKLGFEQDERALLLWNSVAHLKG